MCRNLTTKKSMRDHRPEGHSNQLGHVVYRKTDNERIVGQINMSPAYQSKQQSVLYGLVLEFVQLHHARPSQASEEIRQNEANRQNHRVQQNRTTQSCKSQENGNLLQFKPNLT